MIPKWFILGLCIALPESELITIDDLPVHEICGGTDVSRLGCKNGKQYLAMFNDFGTSYYGVIAVGTPGQKFKVLFDTGTPNFWLPSANCYFVSCYIHNTYDSSQSTSYKASGANFSFNYLRACLSGQVSTDTIQIGDIIIGNQSFAEVINAPLRYGAAGINMIASDFDGVLGLGHTANSEFGVPSLIENMYDRGLIKSKVFSLYNDGQSHIVFGGSDPNHYSGSFTYTPVAKGLANWLIMIDEISFGGQKVCEACTTLVDTGSNLVAGPMKEVAALHKVIGGTPFGNGFFNVSCANFRNYPSLQFAIGGTILEFKPIDYMLGFRGTCITSIVGSEGELWTLGTFFLSTFYVEFDVMNDRIGFAKLA